MYAETCPGTELPVHEDGLHAKGCSNGTSMLAPSPPKARQHMGCSIKTLHLSECADGTAHRLICYSQEPHGHFVQGFVGFVMLCFMFIDGCCQGLEGG